MLRLSKKVEYGLIAIRHIASRSSASITTAKEISDKYDIPPELLAKVLQRLAKVGLVTSYAGVKGGYSLGRKSSEITLSSIINAIDGPQNITDCHADSPEVCNMYDNCTIKNPLEKVQSNIDKAFSSMTLSEIV
jgi:Rrf2 family protein